MKLLREVPLLVLFCAASLAQQPDTWKEYVYPQDGVAISAPKEPVIRSDNNGRMYVGLLENGEAVALMVTTLAGMSDQEGLQTMRESLVHDKTIEPTSISEATVAGHPGMRAVRVFSKKQRYAVRAVYINGRMIKMEAFEGPDADRFFNSLRLVDAEWKEYSYPAEGFRLSSPVEPQFKRDSSTTEYTMDVPQGGYVVLNIPAQAGHDAATARAFLLQFRDSMAGKWQGKLTGESTLESEFPAIGFDYEVPSGIQHIGGRMYYAGSRIYVLLARGKADAERFFAAFHITNPAQ